MEIMNEINEMEEKPQIVERGSNDGRENMLVRLVYLILGIRIPGKRGRVLAAIAKSLKKSGFNYYNFRTGKITSSFADMLYDVYQTIAPFKNFFQSMNETDYISRVLIRCSLTEEQKDEIEHFDEASIRLDSQHVPYNDFVTKIRALYIEFQKQFTVESVTKIDNVYNGVMILRSFCTLDYYFILKKFCPALEEGSLEKKVHFSSVAGDYVANEVIDFASAANALLSIPSWPSIFAFLNELPGHPEVNEESFNDMLSVLKVLRDGEVLLKLARLLQNDNKFEIPVNVSKAEIVKPFLENLYATMKAGMQTVFNEQKQLHISAMVKKIFPEGYSFGLKYYTKEESSKYESCGAGSFTWCDPLEYLQGFLNLIVKDQMHEFMEIFAVRAKLLVNNSISATAAQYHDLLDAFNAIQAFDQKFDQKFPQGYKLKSLYDMVKADPDGPKKLNTEINGLNIEAGALLHKTMSKVNEIFKSIYELRNDCNRNVYEVVDNWNEIEKYLTAPVKESLELYYIKTSEFLKLMSDFGL